MSSACVQRVALVGVDRDDEVRACRVARGRDAGGILLGREAAHLELAAAEAGRFPAGDLVSDRTDVGAVVAADDVDRHAIAIAAPETPQGLADRLPDGVPDGEVDVRDGHQADAAVAQLVVGDGVGELPAALVRERVLTDEMRADLLADDRGDLAEGLVLVTCVGLADDSLGRVDARDDARAVVHAVVAAAILAVERDDERDQLDRFDRQPIQRAHASISCLPVEVARRH